VSEHDGEVVHAARGQIYSREVIPYDIRHALCRGVCPEGIDNPKVLYPQLLTVQKGRLPAIHIELRMEREGKEKEEGIEDVDQRSAHGFMLC
jgi:hypothetical protein